MSKTEKDNQLIFSGMSAGGVNGPEIWNEFIRYLGKNQWQLVIDSDIDGQSSINHCSSADLVWWTVA